MLGVFRGRLGAFPSTFTWSIRSCASATHPHTTYGQSDYYRILQNNPLHHDKSHVGRIYTVPWELAHPDSTDLRHYTSFFPKSFQERSQALQEHSLLVRPQHIEVNEILNNVSLDKLQEPLRFIAYGQTGHGKSLFLAYFYHRVINDPEVVVLNFGSLRTWLLKYRELAESEYKPGRYDLLGNSKSFLQNFLQINKSKLDDLQTHKEYKWSEKESTPKGAPLMDVVRQGLDRPKFSGDCQNVLMREMQLHSNAGAKKTAVIVDGINLLYQGKTGVCKNFKDFGRKMMSKDILENTCTHDELSVIYNLKKLLKHDSKNQMLFASVDNALVLKEMNERVKGRQWWHKKQENLVPSDKSNFPFTLLGKEGWDAMHPFIPMELPEFTESELDTMIDYYVDKRYLSASAGTEIGRREIRFLTGCNPGEFMKYSPLW